MGNVDRDVPAQCAGRNMVIENVSVAGRDFDKTGQDWILFGLTAISATHGVSMLTFPGMPIVARLGSLDYSLVRHELHWRLPTATDTLRLSVNQPPGTTDWDFQGNISGYCVDPQAP